MSYILTETKCRRYWLKRNVVDTDWNEVERHVERHVELYVERNVLQIGLLIRNYFTFNYLLLINAYN